MGPTEETYCNDCGDRMDAGAEFFFLVEAQSFIEQGAPCAQVQSLDLYHGKPLRICKECRASIEQNNLDLEKRAEREKARSRRYRIALAIIGLVAVLALLASVVAEKLH